MRELKSLSIFSKDLIIADTCCAQYDKHIQVLWWFYISSYVYAHKVKILHKFIFQTNNISHEHVILTKNTFQILLTFAWNLDKQALHR